jgi:hypothetical protein
MFMVFFDFPYRETPKNLLKEKQVCFPVGRQVGQRYSRCMGGSADLFFRPMCGFVRGRQNKIDEPPPYIWYIFVIDQKKT